MTVVWGIVAVIVIVLLGLVLAYKGLVRRRNRTAEAWSQIDVELKPGDQLRCLGSQEFSPAGSGST
jgi:hypothetical protein